MSKAELVQLARVFREASDAMNPVRRLQDYGQSNPAYQGLGYVDPEKDREQAIVASVLSAISRAYQRAADEPADPPEVKP